MSVSDPKISPTRHALVQYHRDTESGRAKIVPRYEGVTLPSSTTIYKIRSVNSWSIWHLQSHWAAASLDNALALSGLVGHAAEGDFIFGQVGQGGTPESGIFIVKNGTANSFDISNISALGLLDSD